MSETGQTWMRGHEDDGVIVPGSVQTATLYPDRVVFEDGTTMTECYWNTALPLDAFLYGLDYAPVA